MTVLLLSQREAAWRLARHELLYLAWAGMDAALLTCFALAITPWARYWPAWQVGFLLFALVLLPFNIARLLTQSRLGPGRKRLLLAGLVLPALAIALGQLSYQSENLLSLAWLSAFWSNVTEAGNPYWVRDLVVTFLVTFAWARGIGLVSREVDVDRLGLGFRLGALVLAPLLLVLAGPRLAYRLAPYILAYFLAALLAIALTRAEQAASIEGEGHAMSGRFFLPVALASLALVLLSGLFAALTGSSPLLFLNAWLGPFWLAASMAATTIIAAVAYVSQPTLIILDFVFARLIALATLVLRSLRGRGAAPLPADLGDAGSTWDALIEWLARPGANRPVVNLRLLLIGLLIVVVLLAAIGLGSTFLRRRLGAGREGEPLSAPDEADSAPGSLRGLLARLSAAWRRGRAATIRRIYRRMCNAAEALGEPRLEAETPYEYRAALARVWPAGAAEIDQITDAYVRVRYGEIPETEAELAAIRAAWARLEATLPEVPVTPD